MIGSPKFSVLSRVCLMTSFGIAAQATTIGTIQALFGYDCTKTFMAAAVSGLAGLVTIANARCYPKLSDKYPYLMGKTPCELSWAERGSVNQDYTLGKS